MDPMRNRGYRIIMVFHIVLFLVSIFFVASWGFDESTNKPIVSILVAVASFSIALLLSAWRFTTFHLFREAVPHLSISCTVSHRSLGSNFTHIGVLVILRNSSRVAVRTKRGKFVLYNVAPANDDTVRPFASVYRQGRFKWDELCKATRFWPNPSSPNDESQKGELLIEPGQSHQETIEFRVSRSISSVLVHMHFDNPCLCKKSEHYRGWSLQSFYNLLP